MTATRKGWWWKVPLLVLGGLAVLTATVLAVGLSDFGLNKLRPHALNLVNKRIRGHVSLANIKRDGMQFSLTGLVVIDPQGRRAAAIERLVVHPSLGALAKGELSLKLVSLTRPKLDIHAQDDGLNIAQAFSLRDPPPPKEASAVSKPTRFVITQFQIDDGEWRYQAKHNPPIETKALGLHGAADATWPSGPITLALGATARVVQPLNAPFDVQLSVTPQDGQRHAVKMHSSLGDSGLALQGTAVLDTSHPRVDLELQRAELSPSLASALIPGAPVIAPLNLTGKVQAELDPQRQGQGSVKLELATPGGTVFVTAKGGTHPVPHMHAQVTTDVLNLQKIVRGASRSQLQVAFDCDVKGTGLGKLSGQLNASMPSGSIAGMRTGPVRIAAAMKDADATLQQFDMDLPGLKVNASAQVSGLGTLLPHARIAVNADVQSLELVSRMVAATGAPKLALAGSGRVAVTVSGNAKLAQGQADARFGSLRVGTSTVQGLAVNLTVPALLAPWTPSLRVAANRISSSGQSLSNVHINASSPDPESLVVAARTEGPVPASFHSKIKWQTPGQSFVLEEFALTYPQTQWRNEGRAQISLAPYPRVQNFLIRADAQRLLANISLNDQTLDANVRLTDLDLQRLGAVLGKNFPARGRLSVQLDARGSLKRPVGKVSVQLQNASFGAYGPLAGNLKLAHSSGRVEGSVDVNAAYGNVTSTFNVPAIWPWPVQAMADFHVKASIPSLKQTAVRLGLAPQARPRGALSIDLALKNHGRQTTLDLALNTRDLGIESIDFGDLNVLVRDDGQSPLHGSLKWMRTDFAKRIELDIETQLHIAQLLREAPKVTVAGLIDKPARVKAVVAELDVAKVSKMAKQLQPTLGAPLNASELAGLVDLNVDVKGTYAALQGTIKVAVTGGRQGKLPPTDATLLVDLKPTIVTADARMYQRGRNNHRVNLLALNASVDVPTRYHFNPKLWRQQAFKLNADVGPLSFQHLAVTSDRLGNLRGDLQAHLQAKGVVDHPTVALDVLVKSMKTADANVGDARLHVAFDKEVPSAEFSIASDKGGSLQLRARTKVALPWQSVMAPSFKPSGVPVDLTFMSKSFELAAFSGAVRTIRELKGTLDSTLAFEGTLDKPTFSGELGLRRGTIDIVEVGRLFDVRMDVWANENMLKLDALRCKSGAGDGVVQFEAKRTAGRGFALTGDVDFTRFPLQSPQRKLGEISLRAKAKGRINADGVTIDPLTILETKAFLQGSTPKELQNLDVPDDIVFVRQGEPITKADAEKRARLKHPADTNAVVIARPEMSRAPPSSLPVSVHVWAPRNIWVYAPEGSIEMGFSEDFQVLIDGDTKIFGTVNLRRGTLSVLGRRFAIQDGSNMRFTGPKDQPVIDVSVVHFNETAQVRVFVTASGTPKDLQLKFRSEPELDQSEILTLLVTGRINPVQGGSVEPDRAAQAASIVGGLLAQTVLRQLPIDVLSISAAAIEAGTYVTSNLYVGYVRRLAAIPWQYENINAVHLEYQITEGWSFEGEYGDAGSGSGDLIWKNRY